MPGADFERFLEALSARATPGCRRPSPAAMPAPTAPGSSACSDGAAGLDDLGEHLGDGLYEAEVDYLIRHEWALTDEDILWRRSKLALHVGDATRAHLRAWLGQGEQVAPSAARRCARSQ